MERKHETGFVWVERTPPQYCPSWYWIRHGPEFFGWSDRALADHGWEAPLFERHEAARVLSVYWRELGWEYDRGWDMFVLNAPPDTDETFITVMGRWIPVPGGRMKVYDVGEGWGWFQAD